MTSFTSFISSNPPDPSNNIFSTTGTFEGSTAVTGTVPFGTIDTSLLPETIWISLPNEISCQPTQFGGGVFIQFSPTSSTESIVQQIWTFSSLSGGTSKWAYVPKFKNPNPGLWPVTLFWDV